MDVTISLARQRRCRNWGKRWSGLESKRTGQCWTFSWGEWRIRIQSEWNRNWGVWKQDFLVEVRKERWESSQEHYRKSANQMDSNQPSSCAQQNDNAHQIPELSISGETEVFNTGTKLRWYPANEHTQKMSLYLFSRKWQMKWLCII